MKEQIPGQIPSYDHEKLRKAQEASFEILTRIDRICRARGISYLLDAGTLIGAVRHQGFIPWDDDVDVAMTRENFEMFAELLRKEPELLPPQMELILPEEYRGGEAFYDFTPRIIYKPSRRHTDSAETAFYEGKLNHLWVDIFILDNLPDSNASAARVRFLQKCVYGFAMAHRRTIDFEKYGAADRMKVRLLSAFGHLIPMRSVFAMQKRLSVRYNQKTTKRLYYSNYQPDYLRVTVERSWCEETTFLPFEGESLSVPKEYDAVLREIYGNYMQLPPEAERVPSHSDSVEVFEWEDAENGCY